MYRTFNPATEELIRTYPEMSWEEAHGKAKAARFSFLQWRETSFDERGKFVRRLAEILKDRKSLFASLITQEMGKPIAQAEGEIEKCTWGCEFYARQGEEYLREEIIPTDGGKSYVCYDPLGVILGIMPWNFPFWQVFRFAVPAMMAGNAILLKHAPNVPGSALAIEKIFQEAGFPKDLFQNLIISNEVAASLIESSYVSGISLTGSSRAGSSVASTAGRSLKKTVLELGGSDPFIVLEDADLEKAVTAGVQARMSNAGQSCIAAKRFIVLDRVYSKFRERFVEEVKGLKVGDPMERQNFVGPLAREDLLSNLMRQVDELRAKGAKVLIGGERPKGKGYFYQPTVLEFPATNALAGSPAIESVVGEEEIFGPVASLFCVKNPEEAITLANQTSYGLGASLWTQDRDRAEVLAREIEAGSVFINGMVKSDPRLPFGGIKNSGYGRELSRVGIHEFTNIKTIWVG